MKNCHGIIEKLHFIDQRKAEVQKELYAEQKKRHQYDCILDRMISDGRILWHTVANCEMTKTSWQTGNLKMNEDLENPSRHALFAEGILGRRYSDSWDWRIGKVRCIRNISQKTECKRSPDSPTRWRICISCGRWFSKIIRKRLRTPRTHSETGIHRKERGSQRRISRR